MQCSIVAGAANNILLDSKKHGNQLMKKNILFAPDYVINAGGLINVASEIEGYDKDKVKNKTEQIYDALTSSKEILPDPAEACASLLGCGILGILLATTVLYY